MNSNVVGFKPDTKRMFRRDSISMLAVKNPFTRKLQWTTVDKIKVLYSHHVIGSIGRQQ
jgi:hypothetical protein